MAPYSFFGHLIGVTYSTCCAFDTLSIVSVNLRFHWRQRTWHLGSWNEQRGGRVYVFSISPEERNTSRGKVIFLCCHHEMVQRIRRGLPRSIWIRWYNCWSNENYFIVEVTCFFNTNLYIDFAALQKRGNSGFFLPVTLGFIKPGCRDTACLLHDGSWCTRICITGVTRILLWICLLAFSTSFLFSPCTQGLST